MVGTPGQSDPTKLGVGNPNKIHIPQCEDVPLDETVPPREPEAPRRVRVYIKQRHLEQYGCTQDCEGCKSMRAGGMKIGVGRPHTEKCRKRIEEAMDEDEAGRRWKKRADEKKDEYLEKKVMEAEQPRQAEEEKAASSTGNGAGAGVEEEEKQFENVPVPEDPDEEEKEEEKRRRDGDEEEKQRTKDQSQSNKRRKKSVKRIRKRKIRGTRL